MNIFDCEQGSPEWFQARMGIPTASEFQTVLSKKDAKQRKGRSTYLYKLAGEILTGEPMENYQNAHMERGKIMESEARDLYAFLTDEPIQRVGFIRNGDKGCSPDSLIGERGMVEIKTKLPHLMIDVLLSDEMLPEHLAQCQGGLWVAEREWIDLVVYWPRLPLFVKRVERDDEYIKNLERGVSAFNDELREIVTKIRALEPQAQEAA